MSENNIINSCQSSIESQGILDMIKLSESQDNQCKFTCLEPKDLNNVPNSFKGFGIMKDNIFNLAKPRVTNVSKELKQLLNESKEAIQMTKNMHDIKTKELVSKLLKFLQDLYEFGTFSIDTCIYCKYSEHTCNDESCEYCKMKLNPDYEKNLSTSCHTKEYHKTLFGKIFGYTHDHTPCIITDHCMLQILVDDYLLSHGSGSNVYPILKYFQKINGYSEHWINKICWGSKDITIPFTGINNSLNNDTKDLFEYQCQQDFYKNTLIEFINKVKQYSELITNIDRLRSVLQVLCIDNIGLIKSCLKELRVSDYQNNVTEECIDKCLEDYMNIISEL